MIKVLITGFDPFGGEQINPAYEAIKNISEALGKCEIHKIELPTVFYKSIEVLEREIDKIKPDVVICVGQAGGRFTISLEAVAINLNEARIPDNEGQSPSGKKINPDGENAYFSKLPNKAILKEMLKNNIPAEISYSAGTYVCNHVFYGLMYIINKKHPNLKGGFIHVPYIPEQVVNKKNMPHMDVLMITRALEIAIIVSATSDGDINYKAGTTH